MSSDLGTYDERRAMYDADAKKVLIANKEEISEIQADTGGVIKNTTEVIETVKTTSVTHFDNDSLYNTIKEADIKTTSVRATDNSFKTLKDPVTKFNVARNNTFTVNVDVATSGVNGISYTNIIPAEYIKNIKAPAIRIKENGTVNLGLYEVDLSTIIKSGETLSVEVHENDNRGIVQAILTGLRNYQSTTNQRNGVYSNIKNSLWKIHHTIFDYQNNIKLICKYICTPKFNIDLMMEYENIKVESYTLDFKVVNYNIYDNDGKKLI